MAVACALIFWSILSDPVSVAAHDVPKEIDNSAKDIQAGGKTPALKKKDDRRFLPVPVPISNPTIGSGLELGLMYMWPREKDHPDAPQSISALMGAYTSNPCWMVGLVHQGFYADDTIRLSGALAYGKFNLEFYGIGNDSIFTDDPLDYENTFTFFHPQARFKLPFISNDLFAGLALFYLDADVTFDLSDVSSALPDPSLDRKSFGLGPVLTYDSRDDVHWPTKGIWMDASVLDFDEGIGSDFDFWKYMLNWEQSFPLTRSLVLQYRYDLQYIDGQAPFYQLSYIKLRGFPRGLYTDDLSMTLQAQLRWDIYKKLTLMFFGGGGRVAENFSDIGSNPTRYAGGIGFRYMIAPEAKITLGTDFAYGNDGMTFYVQVGDSLSH